MNRIAQRTIIISALSLLSVGCDRQSTPTPAASTPATEMSSDDMWARIFLGTVDIEFKDGRTGRTGFTLIDEQTIAMSGAWLFGAEQTKVSLLCCDPSIIVGVVAYDSARDVALAQIDPPLRNPGVIPAQSVPDDPEHQYRILCTLPISFEIGPGFTDFDTTIEQRADWEGTGQTLIFQSSNKLVMNGSIVLNEDGYPVAILNGWGGGTRDIGIPLTEVLSMNRLEPTALDSFGPEYMTGQTRADALLHHASNLRNGGQLDSAWSDASMCIELDPDHWRALYELGVLTDMMHSDMVQAVELLDRSIAVEDEWSESHYSRGLVLYKLERYEEAIESLNSSLQLDETNADTHQMLGLSLLETSRLSQAKTSLERAVELAPETYMYLENLIRCYKSLDLPRLAIERSKKFIEDNPHDPEGYAGLGRLALDLRLPRLALEQYAWLDTNLPPDGDTLVRLAFCQIETGDRSAGAATLDRLESLDPGHELLPRLRQELEN